ncbi:MAG: hypothetical protein VX614_09080 [Myxococcota bacterium]|nr:hypothetical protein [Myxococcota bacterium]
MSEAPVDFATVWERILDLRGEFFRTANGRYFTYKLDGDRLAVSQSELLIPRSDFTLAFNMLPISRSAKLNRLVEGPAYVWAILHDERITRGAW